MRVLVTGGAGFIGSSIVEHFNKEAEVRVLDNLRTGCRENIEAFDVEFIEGSITDRAAVKRAVQGVDYVFHLAAMISVPESMEKPCECVEINTTGTLNVLQAAAQAGVKKLCLSSSAANYGDNPTVPKVETMIPEPKSPYAVTKLDGEYYCRIFHDEGWLNTACLRYFNVFGPRQDPRSQYAAAIPIFIHRAVCNEPITIFGDGGQTRDFIFVRDVVAANVYMATGEELTGVYNVAYGKCRTIRETAEKIIELTGSSSKIQYGPVRAGDVRHSQADIDKLLTAGFTPSGQFDEGLSETIEFFKSA
ncbi:MAG: NAD-dependent epimerase/dehydratase family protein [Planctomycetes bacterium]|nr:NAD-dependent epimerase/dehydratase family protein [Planctomycetota bacterium]